MIKKIYIYIKLTYFFYSIKKQQLTICNGRRWKKAFFLFLCNIKKNNCDYVDRWNIIEGFAKSDIKILKKKSMEDASSPILICVVYNELERLEVFLNHYRKMGIKNFAILDNGSVDGSIEYLCHQQDVELFQTKDRFETRIKMGWTNRLISYYGTEYWYLVVDVDELLVWQGIENGSIQGVIEHLKRKNILRARALMIDMYPEKPTWNDEESFGKAYLECKYFDCSTYYHKKVEEVYLVCGGVRKRMLGVEVWLTKYPLFRLSKCELLSNPHTIYPYNNTKVPCYFAILHYKFLTKKDKLKMKKIARTGKYAGGSRQYKLYVKKLQEDNRNFNFYYNESVEYKSSRSLRNIKEVSNILL